MLVIVQENFIFLDDDLPQDHKFNYDTPFEELKLETKDGGNLNAIHFKAEAAKGIILYFHGNRGNLTRWGSIVEPLTQYGYDVLVMDYRGFGKSTGERNQKNLLADAELFYQWCRDRYPEKEITLYGRSLGTGIASYLAGKHEPKKLILETPYYSLAAAAQRYYPIYPSKLALKYNFKSFEYLRTAQCPVIIFHGTEDSVVPYEQGAQLARSLENKDGQLITIEGGEHRNLVEFPMFHAKLKEVLSD